MFKKTKINEKEAGVGPFFTNAHNFCKKMLIMGRYARYGLLHETRLHLTAANSGRLWISFQFKDEKILITATVKSLQVVRSRGLVDCTTLKLIYLV